MHLCLRQVREKGMEVTGGKMKMGGRCSEGVMDGREAYGCADGC